MSLAHHNQARGCRACGHMEGRSATREVQDWQRRDGEKLAHPDGWRQKPEGRL